MPHVKKSIIIHASPDKVHALSRDPNGWPTWWVGMGEIEKLTGDGGAGTVVEYSYLALGIRFPCTTRVLEESFGPEGSRWTGVVEGPLGGQHFWTGAPKDDGTETTVDIEYTVPGALLGKIANRLIVERMVEGNLEQTLQNLKLLCEAD